jgi:TolB-like protein/class 3 adenylate cyclase
MTETRKLAAILAADVVGYSRLMGEDEAGTARAVRERRDAAAPIVRAFGGRLVKTTGDGVLLEFPSVVAAVECAVLMQKMMAGRNAALPEAKRLVYRMGANLGDVLIEGDDILGDGVNVAARLEAICEPGGVCVSGSAYEHVQGRVAADFADLGEQRLKNIAKSVRAYALSPEAIAAAKVELRETTKSKSAKPSAAKTRSALPLAAALAVLLIVIAGGAWLLDANRPASVATKTPAEAARLSIVVLPFANLSGDAGQDYFADGVTENLTTDLSRIPNSFVIARNTAFTYKGKNVDAKEIGKELGVRYVLEGSVQRDQNRVRVNAQLIDAESGAHLWADRFDEDVSDLFKLQDDVVARLAYSLQLALTYAEAEKGARSKNPDATDLRMRGWSVFDSGFAKPATEQREAFHAARALFDGALQIDSEDAEALAGSANTYFLDFLHGWGDPGTDYDAKVLGQANRAINLAPNNPSGYSPKAFYLVLSGRPTQAVSAANAGLAVNPNFVALHQARAMAENSLGRYEEAKADIERAMRISPRDPVIGGWHVDLGDAEMGLGHFDKAIDEYRKSLDMGWQAFYVHTNLAAAYAQAGRIDEARAALANARRLNPAITIKWMKEHTPNLPAVFDGLKKAGLADE